MSREDVFRATGPTSGSSMTVKIGVKRDGTITAAEGLFKLQAGAFPGSPFMSTCMCAFAPYDIPNARAVGYDVVSNRPKVAAYRAPGSPIGAFAVESVLDMLAQKIGMDPLELRLKNAAKKGTQMLSGAQARPRRLRRDHRGAASTIRATRRRSARTRAAASRRATGSTAAASRARPCTSTTTAPSWWRPAAPTSAARAPRWRSWRPRRSASTTTRCAPIVADTASVGYTHVTGGSRVTFATGAGRGRRHQEDHRRAVRARRQDVGRRSRRRGVGGRPRQAGEQQRRRLQADVDQGDRRQARRDRRADRRRGSASTRPRSRPASRPSSATSRSIPRPAR